MDNSINICNEEYFNIQRDLSNNNLDLSVIGEACQEPIDIFNSPKKRGSMVDLEISYTDGDEHYNFEISNTFEVADQEREEPRSNLFRIGNLGQQNPCIDPIQETSFEKEANESMIDENNYFINNDKFSEKSSADIYERLSTSGPIFLGLENLAKANSNCNFSSNLFISTQRVDSTYDESYSIPKYRKSTLKNSSNFANKTELNINESLNCKGSNKKASGEANKSCFVPEKEQLSCSMTVLSGEKKKGRKKCFPDGVKREVLDKVFLRQFKNYLRDSKVFKNFKFDSEEKSFWTEFSQNTNPPIKFTIGDQKVEFKSFSSNMMRFIFSHSGVRQLYEQFSKEKQLIKNLIEKRLKQVSDVNIKNFCYMYGRNMHKVYAMENSSFSIDLMDLMNNTSIVNSGKSLDFFRNGSDIEMSNYNEP